LGHFLQRLSAQPLTDLGQVPALGVAQTEPPFDLVPENAVFLRQIFVSRQQFLVNRAGDIGQQAFPIHGPKQIRNYPSDQGLDHLGSRCEPIDWSFWTLRDSRPQDAELVKCFLASPDRQKWDLTLLTLTEGGVK
jgi:hypothetical protein